MLEATSVPEWGAVLVDSWVAELAPVSALSLAHLAPVLAELTLLVPEGLAGWHSGQTGKA